MTRVKLVGLGTRALLQRAFCFLCAFALIASTTHPLSADEKADAQAETKTEKKDDKKEESTPKLVEWAEITLTGSYPEGAKLPGIFGDVQTNLSDLLKRFEKASEDQAVDGLILKVKSPSLGWGQLNELHAAIKKVRDKGKPVYAWVEAGSRADYLVATACDKIYMPESSMLLLTGIQMEVGFYKNLLEKLDIEAEILQVGDYKGAAEPYKRTEMSPELREDFEKLLDSLYGQIVKTIAEGRGMEQAAVEKAIDQGPLTTAQAVELGLVDDLLYFDEVVDAIKNDDENLKVKVATSYGKKKLDTDFEGIAGMMKMMNLLMGVESQGRKTLTPKVAVIYGIGPIMTGKGGADMFGGNVIGSDTLVKAIKTAGENSLVKAIVLRVDSPGGSALASDLIWRALEQVDKPVVVSMGNVAASGGYYISMGAEKIYAEPGTITGSIGVVGGKMALNGLYEKLGITTSIVSRGKNAGVMSTTMPWSESERKAMKSMMLDIYEQFTSKAAEGRGMKLEKLKELAGGRIYTGEVAVKNGLVDELGTLEDAIAHARELAGLKPDDRYELIELPKPVSPFEELLGVSDLSASRGVLSQLGLGDQLPKKLVEVLSRVWHLRALEREPVMTVLPYVFEIR